MFAAGRDTTLKSCESMLRTCCSRRHCLGYILPSLSAVLTSLCELTCGKVSEGHEGWSGGVSRWCAGSRM